LLFQFFCLFTCGFFGVLFSFFLRQGLNFMILLPKLPKCWDYRCVPPFLALQSFSKESQQTEAGFEPRVLWLQKLHP
jgi:hypothetical protein